MSRCSQCGNNNAQTYHAIVSQPGASPKIYCNICFPHAPALCSMCGIKAPAKDLRVVPPDEFFCKNCFYKVQYSASIPRPPSAKVTRTISTSGVSAGWGQSLRNASQSVILAMLINEIGYRVRLTDRMIASQNFDHLNPAILREFDVLRNSHNFLITTELVAHKSIVDANTLGRSDHLPVDDYVLAALCKHGVKIKRSDIVNNFGKKFKFEVDTETDEDYIVIKAKELP